MKGRLEPEDVEFFVGGGEPDENAVAETVRYIEEYKKRPEYAREVEEADRILAALGVNAREYGMRDAKSLLDHWHRCVAELTKADPHENGTGAIDSENTAGVAESVPAEIKSPTS